MSASARRRHKHARPVPTPRRLTSRRGHSTKECVGDTTAVEHFFCQHATAEEGEPPVAPAAARTPPEHRREAPRSRKWAAGAVSSVAVPDTPDVERCTCAAICPPEGEAQRPIEYWEYDEALWRSPATEDFKARGVTARRNSLTSDEPSEPPYVPSSCVISQPAKRDDSIAAWSDYEQDYNTRRGCLSLTECTLSCP
jgi:hypothetical protein